MNIIIKLQKKDKEMYKIIAQICIEVVVAILVTILTELFLDRFRRPKAQLKFNNI